MKNILFYGLILLPLTSMAAQIKVLNELGQPVPGVMVYQVIKNPIAFDVSDNGYAQSGKTEVREPDFTAFTNENGIVDLPDRKSEATFRLRKLYFKDLTFDLVKEKKVTKTILREKDSFLISESKSANVWLGALELGPAEDKKTFQMQCGFCHQQGTSYMRQERSTEDWSNTIKRMIRYGSRLPTDLQKSLPQKLHDSYQKFRNHPELLSEGNTWGAKLSKVKITEWPIGDSMSQTHDMLIGQNKLVYVADNIQDRLWEVNPKTNEVTVYKIPHLEGDVNGGLISGRLKEFPRHDSTMNAHSLADSKVDGHIFITPSAQQRLVEFDPTTKAFTIHQMTEGFYPHTIRVDAKDNVWFTLALSNQIAKFDRKTKQFTYYDLPCRNLREKFTVRNIKTIFKLMNWGIPLSNWLKIDREYTGTPLAYGIDVTPDGKIWFARLHTKEIGVLNPDNGDIKMIPTPFMGPRRLRTDAEGNLWIVAFGDSLISRYNPKDNSFKNYELPVIPKGSETPYALNVDKVRGKVWVTGNQSNSVFSFDIKTESWIQIPLPRRTTFTRDFEIDEDGSVYTANSNFPSWQVEDMQPTLIKVSMAP